MKITVSGKQMTVRQSLKDLTEKKLAKFDRFFGDDAEATVVFSCRHDLQYMEITINYNGTIFRSEEGAETFQNAIDEAVDSLERQIRKNKTRLEKRLRTGAFVPVADEDYDDEEEGEFRIRTDRVVDDVTKAKNTLTQRMAWPGCSGEVTVDASSLNDGDYAGLCALQSCYGFAAVTKRDGQNVIVIVSAQPDGREITVTECAAVPTAADTVKFRIDADFDHMKDEARFFYDDGNGWCQIGGVHKMHYRLDHFTGYRFALFAYSTEQAGGEASFSDFVYRAE